MKKKSPKTEFDKTFLRQFLGMLMIAPFSVVATIVDTLFISNAFGERSSAYLSAVGFITPVNMFFFFMLNILSNGVNATVSRALGKGDKKQANDLIRVSTAAGLVASLTIAVLVAIYGNGIVYLLGGGNMNPVLHSAAVDFLPGYAIGPPALMLLGDMMPLLPLVRSLVQPSRVVASGPKPTRATAMLLGSLVF